ncbi:MAG: ABC transporter substrate-binding protein [Bacteriovoracaceae bacterium]|nr:ABC transporter substrate-binding protein [Bacteriovoracaceae bacterium]
MKHFFFLFLTLVFTSSCTKEKKSDQLLHLGLPDDPSKWDTALSGDQISHEILSQIYEAPYQYHYLKTQFIVVPLLAADLPVFSEDGLKATIKFKPNIFYHTLHPALQGKKRAVTSKDFEFAIKRVAFIPSASPGLFLIDGRIKGIEEWQKTVGNDWKKIQTTPMEGLKTPDDLTLEISLSRPYPVLAHVLSMLFFAPIPAETLSEQEQYFRNKDDVGTGPYVLATNNPGLEIILKKNGDYREDFFPAQSEADGEYVGGTFADSAGKKVPLNAGIHYHVYKQDQANWFQFLKGNTLGSGIPKDFMAAVLDSDNKLKPEYQKQNFQLRLNTSLSQVWVGINMKHPILGKNKKLREALAYSLDRMDFINKFTHGMGIPAKGIMPVSILKSQGADMPELIYDLEKAKKLLAEAGYPEGKGLPSFNYDIRSTTAEARQQAEWFQIQWKKIGVNLNIVANSFGAYIEKAKKEQLELFLDIWGLDYPAAENVTQLLYSKNFPPGSNVAYYSNSEVDRLHEALSSESDPDKAHELIKQITAQVYEDLPWIPLFTSRGFFLLSPKIRNYRPSTMFYNRLKYWELTK